MQILSFRPNPDGQIVCVDRHTLAIITSPVWHFGIAGVTPNNFTGSAGVIGGGSGAVGVPVKGQTNTP